MNVVSAEELIRPDRKNKGDQPCFACGRATDGTRSVHLRTDGMIVAVGTSLEPWADQGWFPVGPECARKIPAEFVSRS